MFELPGHRPLRHRNLPAASAPRLYRRLCIVFACLLPALSAAAQSTLTESVAPSRPAPPALPVEQDLTLEGLASYGNYRILAGTENCHLYDGGFEYDRHTWGYFLKARMDYAAEFLPVVILNEPAKTDIWGDTIGPGRKWLYGIGISPVGLRMVWRSRRAIRPYFDVKGGLLFFDQKALSSAASYESFTLQEAAGILLRTSPRYDLRLGLIGDFHFSNAFVEPVNPGIDVMNATLGLTWHLGRPRLQTASAP